MACIKREDNVGKIMFNTKEHTVPPLEYILTTEYEYLYKSLMETHPFTIHGVTPGLFKEIVHDKKVVGFSSYDMGCGVMALKYIYVLPEYRGNNLLIKDLIDTKNLFEKHGYPYVAIDTPNWYVINSLVTHGYAKKYNDHLIITKIPLTFQIKKGMEITDNEIEFLEKIGVDTDNEIKSLQANTTIYDENICACVSLDLEMITAMCDEDYKHRPYLMMDRMLDKEGYFSELNNEINQLIKDGVLGYVNNCEKQD